MNARASSYRQDFTNKKIKLAPETPNPYQTPESSDGMQPQRSVRPNFFDWLLAIFLGLLAACFVFPATCFGGSMLLVSIAQAISPAPAVLPEIGLSLLLLIVLGSFALGIYCGLWASRGYLRSARNDGSNNSKLHSNDISRPSPGD